MTKKQKQFLYAGIIILAIILIVRYVRKRNASSLAPKVIGGNGGMPTTLVPETELNENTDPTIAQSLTPIYNSDDNLVGSSSGLSRVGSVVGNLLSPLGLGGNQLKSIGRCYACAFGNDPEDPTGCFNGELKTVPCTTGGTATN